MTAVTAKVAGVSQIVVASPRPLPVILATCHVAGVELLVGVGGAQVIAAFAYGTVEGIPKCDVICGPGNRFVTAAKQAVGGQCGIDMLAGPSECLVLADETADPSVIASDLLAQAEVSLMNSYHLSSLPCFTLYCFYYPLYVSLYLLLQPTLLTNQ